MLTNLFWLFRNILALRGFTTCQHKHVITGKQYFMFCEDCGTMLDDDWPETKERGALKPHGWEMRPKDNH